MPENEIVVDFVVREGNPGWVVWRRSYNPALAWLDTQEVSHHDDREDADLEMRDLNWMHSIRSLTIVREVAEQEAQ